MEYKRIHSALISVYDKEGLEPLVRLLSDLGIVIYSTGGTQEYIESLDISVVAVEQITGYPSILGGRVKTLHPKVFGGILAMRNADHLSQLSHFEIPLIDLVIVDLYPFEETVASNATEEEIIEKIDIGGISLIRAAAKNFQDVVIIPSKKYYPNLARIVASNAMTHLAERKELAHAAFTISSKYDNAIQHYFLSGQKKQLRYGENPHQKGWFEGDISEVFEILGGKELSYNNLVDVDAAIQLMSEFKEEAYSIAILKHTNVCGFASRESLIQAWIDALAGDPISAFGGVIISNQKIDLVTAIEIDKLFYEVLIAPAFEDEAQLLLEKKKNRILLQLKKYPENPLSNKSLLNGQLIQEKDSFDLKEENIKIVSIQQANANLISDLIMASKIAKHLKSNAITLVKNKQLIGMGCGQTSRVDACEQAIAKARKMGFDPEGSAMASEAFFPFPDCVELAAAAKISGVIQPGGSIQDSKSIEAADRSSIVMGLTGIRHFKH